MDRPALDGWIVGHEGKTPVEDKAAFCCVFGTPSIPVYTHRSMAENKRDKLNKMYPGGPVWAVSPVTLHLKEET